MPADTDLPDGVGDTAWAAADEIDRANGLARDAIEPTEDAPPVELADGECLVHASCVSVQDRAALLIGASGSGKSSVALELISNGAKLVADDRVIVSAAGQKLTARPIPGFEGLIEARGIGILKVPSAAEAEVVVVVNLEQTELQRLPMGRRHEILGLTVHLVNGRANPALVPALLALLKGGLWEDDKTEV